MSEFSRKIYRMVGEYRTILRKTLTQSERMQKLSQLKLKVKLNSTTEFEFYQIAQGILTEENRLRAQRKGSYYSYSGVDQFCKHLQEFLTQYSVDNGRVVHVSQFGSKCFLEAVQLLSMEYDAISEDLIGRLQHCSGVLSKYAELDACGRYQALLRRQQSVHPDRFTPLILSFQQQMRQQGRNLLDAQVEQVA